jgi:hypothetical protein
MLSGFTKIAAQTDIVPSEIDHALHAVFGRPERPRELKLFGYGVAHAFGDAGAGLRYDAPADLPAAVRRELERLAAPQFERGVLQRGVDDALRVRHREIDLGFASDQDAYSERLRSVGFGKGDALRRAVLAAVFLEIRDVVIEAFMRAELPPEALPVDGVEEVEEFLRALPSRWAMFEMQRARHAGGGPFEAGDLRDLGALAVAFAYCDIVVTERQWVHIARQAKLDDKFGTVIISDVSELVDLLQLEGT